MRWRSCYRNSAKGTSWALHADGVVTRRATRGPFFKNLPKVPSSCKKLGRKSTQFGDGTSTLPSGSRPRLFGLVHQCAAHFELARSPLVRSTHWQPAHALPPQWAGDKWAPSRGPLRSIPSIRLRTNGRTRSATPTRGNRRIRRTPRRVKTTKTVRSQAQKRWPSDGAFHGAGVHTFLDVPISISYGM